MSDRAEKAGSILLTLWICILIPVLFFHTPEGYRELGNNKFEAWRMISVPFFLFLLLCVVICGFGRLCERTVGLCLPDLFLILYTAFLFISFLFSTDRAESLWGTTGWRMGFLTELIMVGSYFFARLFPIRKRPVLWTAGICSALLLSLAVLDSFGFPLLPFQGMDSSFIATIGNLDWYCGCLALMLSLAAGVFLCSSKGAEMAGSGFLLFFAILSACIQRAVTGTILPVVIVVFSAHLFFSKRAGKAPEKQDRRGIVFRVASGFTALVLIVFFTGIFLLPLLFLDPAKTDALFPFLKGAGILSDLFGNGRGAIWRISWEAVRSFSPQRLFCGIGPDALAAWGYGPESPILSSLISAFGAARLTNAHSELLTILIEEGAPACAAWLGFVISCFVLLRKACLDNRDPWILIALFSLITLEVVQAVTFRTVVATPLLFPLLGRAVTLSRKPSFMNCGSS